MLLKLSGLCDNIKAVVNLLKIDQEIAGLLLQKICANCTKTSASYLAKSEVTAELSQTYLNTFKLGHFI